MFLGGVSTSAEATSAAARGNARGRQFPSRRILDGHFTTPLLATGTRWAGVAVELFRAASIDALLQSDEHVVGVQLRGCKRFTQAREGRCISRPVRPGDVMVTPAGPPKRWRCDELREWITVRLDPAALDRVAGETARRHGTVQLLDNFGTRDTTLENIGRCLVCEAQTDGLASDVYVDSLATELAVHLLRRYSTATVSDEAPQALPERKLRRARDFVDANLAEPLTVRRIADAIAMSPFHFAHVFQQTTGQTPHRFVVERRIERAKWLLNHTELPIIEVAHEVGCRNPAHFSVLFRRETGTTPTDYRRTRR